MGQTEPGKLSRSCLVTGLFVAILATTTGCEFSKIKNGSVGCAPEPPACPSGYYCNQASHTCWENNTGPDASGGPGLDATASETSGPIDGPGSERGPAMDGPGSERGPAMDGGADATIDVGQPSDAGALDMAGLDLLDAPPAGPEAGRDVDGPVSTDDGLGTVGAEPPAAEAGLPGPEVGGPDAADARPDTMDTAADAPADTGPLPVVTAFSATPATVTVGKSSTLQWTVTGAATVTIDQGVGSVASASSKVVTPGQTTTYTLTAQNAGGGSVTAQAVVTVVPLPTIDSFTANPATISAGSSTTLLAVFHGGTAATVSRGVGNLSSGSGVSVGPLGAGATYTLTVTNAAGDSVTADTTVTVVPLPTISGFTADATTISVGASANLLATFANGVGTVDNNIGAVTSGVGVNTGSLSDIMTYTLTVTNPAGDKLTAQVTVRVVGFATTGSLTAPRMRHTATRLTNGTVLIAGGWTVNYAAVATAEIYNPATGKFTVTTGPMSGPREYHTATLLASGKVLITGGIAGSSGSGLPSAELYDPSTGTFTPTTGAMTIGRYAHTATLLDSGKVFIAGGWNDTGTAEIYDPGTSSFTAVGNAMTVARSYHTATLVGSKVVLAGGYGLSSAEVYDTVTTFFTATTNAMNAVRRQHTATLLGGGKILVAGGYYSEMGNTIPGKSADLYNPASPPGSFAATGAMATGRALHTATLLTNGQLLIAGGDGQGAGTTAELYDSTGATATVTGSLNTSRYDHTATLLTNGKVLIAGGQDGTTIWSSAEVYIY